MKVVTALNRYLSAAKQIREMPKDTVWKAPPCDVLFLAKDVDRSDRLDGLAVDRVLDPLQAIFENEGYKCCSVAYPGSKLVGKETSCNVLSFSRKVLWHEFRKSLNLIFVKLRLKSRASLVPDYEKIFRMVLRRLQPKLILTIGADPNLCRAALSSEIPILEVLHARGYGIAFPGWNCLGASELPDGVIAYDDLSAEVFERLLPVLQVPNFRLPFELELARKFLKVSPPPFSSIVYQFRHVILFTASYDLENPSWPGGLPVELIDFARQNSDLFLLVRLHPVMRVGPRYAKEKEALERDLQDLPNCDTDWASTAPLYAVLEVSTIHFTYNSMSAYEAADTGLVSFAIGMRESNHENLSSGNHMRDLREQGLVVLIEGKSSDFLSILNENVSRWIQVTSEEKIDLNAILEFASKSSQRRIILGGGERFGDM